MGCIGSFGLVFQGSLLCSRKKEGAPTLCSSMDGTREHYTKWNKPGSKRQIPYDLTYKWNLINKKNKQVKYNQRHWNKEQTGRTREDGEGDNKGKKGKGCQGTRIKDPWTKPKGCRIEGRRWVSMGQGVVVRGKWRQLYLNSNKKKITPLAEIIIGRPGCVFLAGCLKCKCLSWLSLRLWL